VGIISLDFLYLTSITIIVYYCLNKKAQNIWLLLVSYFFYYNLGWLFPVFLFLSSFINFWIGKKISSTTGKTNRVYFYIGLIGNIAAFSFFKFINYPDLISGFSSRFLVIDRNLLVLLIPIGFSFYCLQGIAYLIDIYKTRIKAEDVFWDFALFIAFFPKLIAGPIERASSLLPQIKKDRLVDNKKIDSGFTQIIIGLFRKIVIAGLLIYIIPKDFVNSSVINSHPSLGLLSLPFFNYTEQIPYYYRLFGIIGYVIYLYNDFAGYSSIVCGISLLMGFSITNNFRQPFLAHTFMDFWSRWHVSLSSWLRDYIYFPITRALLKSKTTDVLIINIGLPLTVTLIISGLWHGFIPTMILWGLIQGILITFEHLVYKKWPLLNPSKKSKPIQFVYSALVFSQIVFSFVPFAAKSVPETLAFWKVIFKGSSQPIPIGFILPILLLIILSFVIDIIQNSKKDESFVQSWPLLARASALVFSCVCIAIAAIWTMSSINPQFVYQGF
jgi:alginate O-acetyltransferase complex protein AlgI